MRYPECLPDGGTVGFLAPAFGCATEPYLSCFKNAQSKWKKLGYQVVLGANCYENAGIGISNTPEKCGAEVMEMFARKDVHCLISCGGGELMCEILPHVDFEKLAEMAPKWFMGYSDNTNLTYLLATLADTASVYGPGAKAFGMEPWHDSVKDAFGILTGRQNTVHSYGLWEKEKAQTEDPLAPYHVTEPLRMRLFLGREEISLPKGGAGRREMKMSGRLLGGCLDCLTNLAGTRYDGTSKFIEKYKQDGILWFLEACDLNVFSIRRAMWQLEEAGWFQYVKGFLIGRPLNGAEMMGLDSCNAVLETAGRKNVPVILDVDLGHLPPMMPLVVGSLANVTFTGQNLTVEMIYA